MNNVTEKDRDYLELCKAVLPRPIRDEDEYRRARKLSAIAGQTR